MIEITIGSLCAGYGGLELGLMLAAWRLGIRARVVWQVDVNPYACAVLRARRRDGFFSKSIILEADIEAIDYTSLPHADIVCAGLPCQPWTNASDQRGEADERNLFPAFFSICDTIQPSAIFLENADELTSISDGTTFRRIAGEIAARWSYCEWGTLTASSVGADHGRERLFVTAHTHRERLNQPQVARSRTYPHHAQRNHSLQERGRRSVIPAPVAGRAHSHTAGQHVEGSITEIPPRAECPQDDAGRPASLRRKLLAQSGFCRADDGLAARLDRHRFSRGLIDTSWDIAPRVVFQQKPPDWNNRLAALGNGVVPQQAAIPAQSLLEQWLGVEP